MSKNLTENTCRVCLHERDVMRNIFDEVIYFKSKLSDLLEYCGEMKIDINDSYPKVICEECTGELIVAAKFREKCKLTLEVLSQFVTTETLDDVASDTTDDTNTFIKKEELADIESSVEDFGDSSSKGSWKMANENDLYEQVEFLDASETPGNYIVFEGENTEETVDDVEAKELEEIELTNNENSEQNEQDFMYEESCKEATNNVVRILTGKTTVAAKPLIINCKCDVCGAGFIHFNNLRKHLQTHNPVKIFTCSYCACPFTKIENLNEHVLEHESYRIMNDNIIKETGPESESEAPPSNVRKKFILVSTDEGDKKLITFEDEIEAKEIKKNHTCHHCEKRFVSKSALSAHLRIHTGDRPFRCCQCSKTFTTQGGLDLHMRRHSGLKPFSCDICGKKFVESSNLKVHMRMHTGEKPHKCITCERSFARVFLLKLHQRTHTGERPYRCPYCERAFAQQGDLAAHKRIHTGERPHICPFCSKGFIKSSGLTQHMRKHSKFEIPNNRNNKNITSDIIGTEVEGPNENDDDRLNGLEVLLVDNDQQSTSNIDMKDIVLIEYPPQIASD